MKKTVLSFLIICIIITSAFSQNGYKGFKWGMTSEQVSKIVLVPEIERSAEDNDDSPTFQKNSWQKISDSMPDDSDPYDDGGSLPFIMYYLYKSELKDLILFPNKYAIDFVGYNNGRPYSYPGGYYPNNESLEFFFSKNKLVGVVTYFHNNTQEKSSSIISELEEKYGEGFSLIYNSSRIYHDYQTGVEGRVEGRIWLDNKRFVVWSRSDNSSLRGMEFVTYLDAEWSKEICKKCIENFRKEKSQIRSRLD